MTNPPQSAYSRARLCKMNYKHTKKRRIVGTYPTIDTSLIYHTIPQYPKALPVGKFR